MKHLVTTLILAFTAITHAQDAPPNIVYIMSDELAYYELGHMGNPYIKTPRIDQMARDGLRFTNALAASPVCAPLRGCMMTGKHSGHASVRANDGGTPLRAEEPTIASVLKQRQYATGGFGKWGAGGRDSTGVPEKHGFDVFYGYYDQVHAHSFYPPYLVRNSEEVVLEGNVGGRSGKSYSHYAIMNQGLQFIRDNKDKPFFCYLPITPPHGMYDIPADDPAWDQYKDEAWIKDPSVAQDIKNYTAMVTMIDNNLGSVLDLLKELKLADNTVIFFTGDNGGQDRFKSKAHPRGFFGPNVHPKTGVEFRGGKGNLYEGGLKIPFLVQWPGKVAPGRVSKHVFYQPDIMATLADISDTKAPADTDGISILPEILGDSANQKAHEMLYWEYGSQTAVRFGKWKAVQSNKFKQDDQWELFDLEKDISETTNLRKQHPDILARMQAFAKASHEPARPGTYLDDTRKRHERDRQAKWGSSRPPEKPKKGGKLNKINAKNLIPADELSLIRFSSENHSNDRRAAYAIDGRANTVWHSHFSTKLAKHPHELVIDMGSSRTITGFRYLARQDASWNGSFGDTEFYLSDSAGNFPESPAVNATFTKSRKAQKADCPQPIKGRYLLIRNLTEVNKGPWGSAAEIGVIEQP